MLKYGWTTEQVVLKVWNDLCEHEECTVVKQTLTHVLLLLSFLINSLTISVTELHFRTHCFVFMVNINTKITKILWKQCFLFLFCWCTGASAYTYYVLQILHIHVHKTEQI